MVHLPLGAEAFGAWVARARDAYARHAPRLLPSQARALRDIARCHTAALGGHRYRCEDCGGEHWVYHACRNRACPACHHRQQAAWLAARQAQLWPCGYFHVVATVAPALRGAFLADQKALYGRFMQSVAESLLTLARQERFLGATPGLLMVLHTWNGQLEYHPHVHVLVTAGGITDDGAHWRSAPRGDFFVPVRLLSRQVRHTFRAALARHDPARAQALPAHTWTSGWNTFCKGYGSGATAVVEYLARYVFRVAITPARLVELAPQHITFRYTDRARRTTRSCTLETTAFLDRFVRHVLPRGFHKVRYYGLWHPSQRLAQQACRLLALEGALAPPPGPPPPVEPPSPEPSASAPPLPPPARPPRALQPAPFVPTCPYCGSPRLVCQDRLTRAASP